MNDTEKHLTDQFFDLYNSQEFFINFLSEMLTFQNGGSVDELLKDQLQIIKRSKSDLTRICQHLNLKKRTETSPSLKLLFEEVGSCLSKVNSEDPERKRLLTALHRLVIYGIAGYITLIAYTEEFLDQTNRDTLSRNLAESFQIAERVKVMLREPDNTHVV